ncbi:MAG: small basic family protein [Armatimonadetes bacterium]|nr:small basic family protein [Armatimonadota bacterium]
MTWVPVVGLVIGFIIIYATKFSVPADYASYLSLATLAGLDTIFGGVRAAMEGKFDENIFVSGFVMNTLLAAGLAYLGDQLGVDLFLAAVVALGGRIFLNLSLIRRYYLSRVHLSKKKEEQTGG